MEPGNCGPDFGETARELGQSSLDICEALTTSIASAFEVGNPGEGTVYRDLQELDLVVD